MQDKLHSTHNFIFWFHLFITALAWVAPFLISWPIVVAAYGIILLQFLVFGRCLLNAKHDLTPSDNATFYSYLLELCGISHDRALLKVFVRRYLYFILGLVAVWWQYYLGHKALLF